MYMDVYVYVCMCICACVYPRTYLYTVECITVIDHGTPQVQTQPNRVMRFICYRVTIASYHGECLCTLLGCEGGGALDAIVGQHTVVMGDG